jgi:hypothetical protein
VASLTAICVDQMGRDALKANLKKIEITSKRSWSSLEVTMKDGVLNLDADPSYARTEYDTRDWAARISKVLEANL